jgi:hypothetical protein
MPFGQHSQPFLKYPECVCHQGAGHQLLTGATESGIPGTDLGTSSEIRNAQREQPAVS